MDYGPIVVAIVLIFGVLALVIMKKSQPKTKKTARHHASSVSLGRHDFHQQWQRIEGIMLQPGLESTRSAIFEADKLLDAALRQSGFRGETMGERLKNARDHFGGANPVYQGLWEAHKTRNALAHELGFDLPKSVAQQHLAKFEAGLRYLKVL